MTHLIKSSVKIYVNNKPIVYVIFHAPEIKMDYIVDQWVRVTDKVSNKSLVEFIRKEMDTPHVYTKIEAKQLNIKRTL